MIAMNSTHVSAQSHHLPQQFTSFVGREQELDDICAQLADPACRLLTLVGPGGIGKTRLAMQTTAVATTHFPDGTYFVNLQAVDTPDLLVVTIAETTGLSLSGQETPLRELCQYLADKRLLLTLDNFEQLLDGADFIVELLQQTAVSFLITSREPLNLQEEWLFPVQGLPLNDTTSAAVQLFADRAKRVQPQFKLDNEQDHVVRICQLVEGMPLAIELAAAWTRSLPCADIVTEIQANLDFLSTQVRNIPERHRSIQTIFEQTWQQLCEAEQSVFKRLAVFRGGFRREAATAVAGANLSILSDLIDKSLLRWEADAQGNGRYQIHELLRQYAAEKLHQNQDEADETRQQHTKYYKSFLADRMEPLMGTGQQVAMAEIQSDLENVRFAWNQILKEIDFENLEQATMTLHSFFWHQSRYLEGQQTFSKLVDVLETYPPSLERDTMLALALNNLATFLMMLGDLTESTRLAMISLELFDARQIPPPAGMDTDPRLVLANNSRLLGDFETAVAHSKAALAHNQKHNHLPNMQEAYRMIAEAQIGQKNFVEAWHHAEQALALAQESDELSRLAYTHETLGGVADAEGKADAAEHHYQKSYEMWTQLSHDIGRADMLQRLGDLALNRQEYAEAQTYYEQCLPLFTERHVSGGILGTQMRLGQTAVYQKAFESARQHFLQALPIAINYPNQFGELTTRLLLGAAHLFIHVGYQETAISLLAFLVDHPQLEKKDQERGQDMLKNCQSNVEPEVWETAVSQGKNTSLQTHLANLKTTLVTPLPTAHFTDFTTVEQPLIDPLTPRELEVLGLIADGLSNQEIADKLFISKGTVKYYSSHIYSKLQVSSRTQAVAQAREIGILKE